MRTHTHTHELQKTREIERKQTDIERAGGDGRRDDINQNKCL